jgi:ABC-type iron transport system FetAB permease component
MSLFLLLIIVAFVLGIIGAAADGLGFLLAIAVILFIADLVYGFTRLRGRRRPVR